MKKKKRKDKELIRIKIKSFRNPLDDTTSDIKNRNFTHFAG